MPPRGHPDSAAILAARNSHNSEVYKNLSDDQSECLTKRVFHALGGCPDYSAIPTENLDTESSNEIVVPEVPTLEPDEEARLLSHGALRFKGQVCTGREGRELGDRK